MSAFSSLFPPPLKQGSLFHYAAHIFLDIADVIAYNYNEIYISIPLPLIPKIFILIFKINSYVMTNTYGAAADSVGD